jgi:hypothetical protein
VRTTAKKLRRWADERTKAFQEGFAGVATSFDAVAAAINKLPGVEAAYEVGTEKVTSEVKLDTAGQLSKT